MAPRLQDGDGMRTIRRLNLNIAATEARVRTAGPGDRFVLWVQGCPLRCPGCLNEALQPFVERHRVEVVDLVRAIRAVPGIEGITISGGEPFAQARACAALARAVRGLGLSVMVYTGFTLEALASSGDRWVLRLLGAIDLLLDGPFLRDQARLAAWRGSTNQRLHVLSDRYPRGGVPGWDQEAAADLRIGNGALRSIGIWPPELLDRMQEYMRKS